MSAEQGKRAKPGCGILSLADVTGDPPTVARQLLGKILVSRIGGTRCAGRIVETEAYLAKGDAASHSARGKTKSNASMFDCRGTAYVYPIHAKWCFNVVTEEVGSGSAVLIRALEPIQGIGLMYRRRGVSKAGQLTSGPAKLCQALGIDRRCDGINLLTRRTLWLETGDCEPGGGRVEPARIKIGRRIGVTSARELPLRFSVVGSPFVSRPA